MTAPQAFSTYVRQVQEQLDHVLSQDGQSISDAADWICAAILNKRPLYVFGASHAGLLAQDLFYRAGGLVPIEPIMPAGLMLNERPVQRTSRLERLPGFAQTFMADVPLAPDDVVLVISVSGRNAAPVEVCQIAQSRASVEPRGVPRLFEVADLTIDLRGVPGDAVVNIEGASAPVGPTSTAVGSAILHGLMCEVAARLHLSGLEPPVLASGNLDGSDERNRKLMDHYRDQISYAR